MKKGKASATAALILEATLLAAKSPVFGKLISPEAETWGRLIARRVLTAPWLYFLSIGTPLIRKLIEAFERQLSPGFLAHVASRKAFIEESIQLALDEGYTQLLVIGAGYDTLSLRVAVSHPNVTCFELDHPDTQHLKQVALAESVLPPNLHFVAADLSKKSLAEALGPCASFDPKLKTVVVVEGVFMYLSEENVRSFFIQIKQLLQGKITCVFTFMSQEANGDISFSAGRPVIKWWLKMKSEMFLWGIEKHRLPEFLAFFGFNRTQIFGREDFIRKYFANESVLLSEGEYIAISEVDGSSK